MAKTDAVGSVFPSQSTVWRNHGWGEHWAKAGRPPALAQRFAPEPAITHHMPGCRRQELLEVRSPPTFNPAEINAPIRRQAALHPCPQRILGFFAQPPNKEYFGACVSRAAPAASPRRSITGGRPLPRSR
jgi:hypothetical protein